MSREVTVAELKNQLSSRVHQAEHGEPVVITRRGKPVAALVSTGDLEQLERLRAAGPGAGFAGLAGGWEGSEEFAEGALRPVRTPERPVPYPE